MPRGGRRAGRPGADYANRTDMQLGPRTAPVVRIPNQTYGQQAQQVAAQQQVPMGTPAVPPLTPLDAPSQRPNEPVTHGLPSGPGAGPEALGITPDPLSELRAIYQAYPSQELLGLILDEAGRATP